MRRFIGREAELNFLNEKYNSDKGELIVLYGRRRIGKTELLNHFSQDKPCVFYSCSQSLDRVQLRKFSEQMFTQDLPARRYISEFSDWEEAFRSIAELPFKEKKKLVIIDEFPYMSRGNPSVPSILQNLWDHTLRDENVMLVLCGSSMSFMEKEILSEKSPLYGRATGIYKMPPLSFYESIQFFPHFSAEDKFMAYAILGGVPQYLQQFDDNRSLRDNITDHILSKGAPLYNETEFLLRQELRETAAYNSIITALAMGSTKLNEISQKSMVDNTAKTSVYLSSLIELGIVEKEFSINTKKKAKISPSKASYQLADHFFKFWYAFVFPFQSELELGNTDEVYSLYIENNLNHFASHAFELVCQSFMRELRKYGRTPFKFFEIGKWEGKTTVREPSAEKGYTVANTEIDIMAIDPERRQFILGECKYRNIPFSYSEYLNFMTKLSPEKNSGEFYYMLFSKTGFDPKISETDHLKLFTLEDIVLAKEPGHPLASE